jgi:hypothetical protein
MSQSFDVGARRFVGVAEREPEACIVRPSLLSTRRLVDHEVAAVRLHE